LYNYSFVHPAGFIMHTDAFKGKYITNSMHNLLLCMYLFKYVIYY